VKKMWFDVYAKCSRKAWAAPSEQTPYAYVLDYRTWLCIVFAVWTVWTVCLWSLLCLNVQYKVCQSDLWNATRAATVACLLSRYWITNAASLALCLATSHTQSIIGLHIHAEAYRPILAQGLVISWFQSRWLRKKIRTFGRFDIW